MFLCVYPAVAAFLAAAWMFLSCAPHSEQRLMTPQMSALLSWPRFTSPSCGGAESVQTPKPQK
jgi:hypothetical protein